MGEENYEIATFAGGCFWCTEHEYDDQKGIIEKVSGYIGGEVDNPKYEEVKKGTTGHKEAVQVTFDPSIISYDRLLNIFWRHIDPTDDGGQFEDRGDQYRTAIFYHSDEQKALAEASRDILIASHKFDKPIATKILPATQFYSAEEYHQNFKNRNPEEYDAKTGPGRENFKKEKWCD